MRNYCYFTDISLYNGGDLSGAVQNNDNTKTPFTNTYFLLYNVYIACAKYAKRAIGNWKLYS